jgi:nucleoid-associated protein YgaU
MSQKLIIQVLVLLGLAGAGAAGYHLSQQGPGSGQPQAETPAAGDTETRTTAPGTAAKTDESEAGETSGETADAAGGKSVEERLAAIPSFDLMRVEKDGSAVVAGRTEAGAIVALLANGKVVGKGIANAAGEFAIVLDEPLPPGAHSVTLETRDAAGATLSESNQSMAVSVPEDPAKGDVLVMLNEPGAPSQVLQKPQIADVGAPAADAAGEAAATAEAPADTASGETQVAAATDATSGGASGGAQVGAETQDKPQAQGQTQSGTAAPAVADAPSASATADATDTATDRPAAAGDTPAETDATRVADAPAPASSTDTAAATAADAPAPAAAPADAASGAATAARDADTGGPATVTVEAVETEKDKVFVAGAGEPNSEVRVYVDNKLVGEAKTDSGGRWLLETQGEVKPGEVAVRADQVKPDGGAVVARAEVTFAKEEDAIALRPVSLTGTAGAGSGDSASTGTRAIPSIIIRRGDNLWTISQRRYGEGVRYTTIYQANKDQIRNPDLIYPGQVFMMPEGDRNWPEQRSTGG